MSSHLSRTVCRVSAGSGSVCVPPSRSGAGDVRRKYRQEVSPRLTKLYRDRGLPTGTLGSVASGCGARDGAVPQVVCGWLVWGEEGGGPGRAALGCLMTVCWAVCRRDLDLRWCLELVFKTETECFPSCFKYLRT